MAMGKVSELLTPEQAAAYLGEIPTATLAWWRARGRGPKFIKIGRAVRYRASHLDEYLSAGERNPS